MVGLAGGGVSPPFDWIGLRSNYMYKSMDNYIDKIQGRGII